MRRPGPPIRFAADDERGMHGPIPAPDSFSMLRELDTRTTPEGDNVAIWWDDETGDVQLVFDHAAGESWSIPVARDRAADAFRHPWAYAPAHVGV
jgi:hypothetical protein